MLKDILFGFLVFVVGFIILGLFASIFDGGKPEFSYFYGIIFSVLYLSSIVAICFRKLLRKLDEIR